MATRAVAGIDVQAIAHLFLAMVFMDVPEESVEPGRPGFKHPGLATRWRLPGEFFPVGANRR
ncbi:MAG: hypothetical protein SV598_08030 [Pseudomonadota bacterium]|nr:hypothetical protein [Pseudomonadota bacterium]